MSTSGPEGVSVVTPTYNRRWAIDPLVRAVLADQGTREFIVVVDGCEDGSYERLRELAQEDDRLRPVWRENGGEAAARQSGLEAATQPVVVFLDDDVVPGAGLIAGHGESHRGKRRQVMLGYMPVSGPPGWSEGVVREVYGRAYEHFCRLYEANPAAVLQNLWAGNMSLRRTEALEVGLEAGPRLPFHADREFGLRLLKAGFTGSFDRSLLATHHYTRSFEGFCRDALESGRATWLLHELHADVLGPFSIEHFTRDLPIPDRALARLAGQPRGALIVPALSVLVRLLGRMGTRRATIRAMAPLTAMLRQHGALEASRRGSHQIP